MLDVKLFVILIILTCLRIVFRRTTIGRIPLDEWSVRHRDLYLTTLTTDKQTNIHAPGGIRSYNLSRRAGPKTYALDRAATGTGKSNMNEVKKTKTSPAHNSAIKLTVLIRPNQVKNKILERNL